MLKVRPGLFETNSSSTHSVAIKNQPDSYYTLEEMKASLGIWKWYPDLPNNKWDGHLFFSEDELSFLTCDFKLLTSFASKVYFAIASFNYNTEEDIYTREDVENLLYELIPGLKSISYDYEDAEDGTDFYGLIDHQSIGVLQKFFIKHPQISLKEFLTNKKYIVFIDDDNSAILPLFTKAGLIHKEDFQEVLLDY